MRTLKIIKYAFLLVGTILIAISIIGTIKNNSFLNIAISTQGVVTGFDSPYNEAPSSATTISSTYRPLIQFKTQDGKPYTFKPSFESSSDRYTIGESIPILYDENNPKQASIDSFTHLWAGILIVGGLGLPFFLVGFILFYVDLSKQRNKTRLKEHGVRITTQFHKLAQNSLIEVNGQNPFQILTRWENPTNSKAHIFKSDNIWLDPTEFLPQEINVYIEKDNPEKYYVDLSFLPAT